MKKIILLMFIYCLWVLNTAFAAVDLSGWAKYAENLQNCKAGTFNLPDLLQTLGSSNPESITYQITGMNAGTCMVIISRTIQNPGAASSILKLNCAFAAADLPALSKSAKDIVNGNMSSDDPSGNIMNKSCQQAS